LDVIKKINPNFRSKFDALFLYLHAIFQCYGFKIVGLGETEMIENKELPMEWNQSTDAWAFRYKHFKSSMTFLLKALKLNDTLIVYGIALEQKEMINVNLVVGDYVNDQDLTHFDELYKGVEQLENLIVTEILKKFIPSVNDEQPPRNNVNQQQNNENQQQTNNNNQQRQPLHEDDFDYDPLRIPDRNRVFRPGRDNLYPYGEFSPFGSNPYGPGFFTPEGQLVGPNHPGFGPNVNNPYYHDPYGLGIPRNDRRRMPPPGSRFDPFGPPNTFGDPDRNDFPPPGWYS